MKESNDQSDTGSFLILLVLGLILAFYCNQEKAGPTETEQATENGAPFTRLRPDCTSEHSTNYAWEAEDYPLHGCEPGGRIPTPIAPSVKQGGKETTTDGNLRLDEP